MPDQYFNNKLLPAVTVTNTDTALSVAEALLEGGLDVMEITFRTGATAGAITAIAKELPEMHVGAGTILSSEQVRAAKEAGAQFGLAPGLNVNIVRTSRENDFPFIPGVMTPSEIERAFELGLTTLKLFPAADLGGVEYIQSLEGPYSYTGIKLIPMGGVNSTNLKRFLSCESVIAAGGSWMTPGEALSKGEFDKVINLVRESLKVIEGNGK